MEQKSTGLPADGERVETAAVALGLPEFVVLAAGEYGGEVELLVETLESVTGCPRCGVVATLHDRKPRWVRDLPLGGRPVVLVWFKRVWRCEELTCAQRTWSERTEALLLKQDAYVLPWRRRHLVLQRAEFVDKLRRQQVGPG